MFPVKIYIAFFFVILILSSAGVFANPLFAPIPQDKPADMCVSQCHASERVVRVIGHFEGYSPFPYKDAVGIETVGFGHVILPQDAFTYPLLPQDADALLRKDVGKIEKGVKKIVIIPLWQYQHDALVSFAFNVGTGKLSKSTLLRKVNGQSHADVPPQFGRWVYAGKRKLRGLELRRKVEAELYAGNLSADF